MFQLKYIIEQLMEFYVVQLTDIFWFFGALFIVKFKKNNFFTFLSPVNFAELSFLTCIQCQ